MRIVILVTSCVCVLAAVAWCEAAMKAGDLVLSETFAAADALSRWPARAGTVRLDTGAVLVESTDKGGGAHADISLPAARLRGCKLIFSARVKAENVSAKPNAWNGIKRRRPHHGRRILDLRRRPGPPGGEALGPGQGGRSQDRRQGSTEQHVGTLGRAVPAGPRPRGRVAGATRSPWDESDNRDGRCRLQFAWEGPGVRGQGK